jgi:Heterokaryon incompatibility protein (HET)
MATMHYRTPGVPKEVVEYNESEKKRIYLNSQDFMVYPNLLSALEQFAKAKMADFYWIDAICINQNDFTEREIQVNMMVHIYSRADQVDIWLGNEVSRAASVIKIVKQIAKLGSEEAATKLSETSPDGVPILEDNGLIA